MITIVLFGINALVAFIDEKNDTNIRRQLSIISQTSKRFLGDTSQNSIVYSGDYIPNIRRL